MRRPLPPLYQKGILVALLVSLFLAACSSGTSISSSGSQSAGSTPLSQGASPVATPACPYAVNSTFVEATAIGGDVSVVIESTTSLPILAGHDVKIRWTIIGSGPLQVVAHGPAGLRLLPAQGPTEHTSPPNEWGTLFNFPSAGCWNLHVTRDHTSGDIWLDVQ